MPGLFKDYLTVIVINAIAAVWLLFSLIKSRQKTKRALVTALTSFIKTLPAIIIVVLFIGFLLGFVPQELIAKTLGEQSGFLGILITAALGSILFMPAIISFPLAASLLNSGASVMAVSAFITTLTMVGIATLPLEIKEMGKQITLLRNLFSLIFAVLIAMIMGVIL